MAIEELLGWRLVGTSVADVGVLIFLYILSVDQTLSTVSDISVGVLRLIVVSGAW